MAFWLTEARQSFDTLRDLVGDLQTKPEEALPLFGLTRQAEAMAKNRLKGQASVFAALNGQRALYMEQGSRGAVRDAAALWYLFVGVNERFRQDRRALTLLVGLLASDYRALLHSHSVTGAAPLRDRIASALLALYSWYDAVDELREQYYEGVNALMPEAEEHLSWLVEQAELLAAWFNDHLQLAEAKHGTKGRGPRPPAQIDTSDIRKAARQSVDGLVRSLVAMARTEAYEMMGEHKEALAFAQRHL